MHKIHLLVTGKPSIGLQWGWLLYPIWRTSLFTKNHHQHKYSQQDTMLAVNTWDMGQLTTGTRFYHVHQQTISTSTSQRGQSSSLQQCPVHQQTLPCVCEPRRTICMHQQTIICTNKETLCPHRLQTPWHHLAFHQRSVHVPPPLTKHTQSIKYSPFHSPLCLVQGNSQFGSVWFYQFRSIWSHHNSNNIKTAGVARVSYNSFQTGPWSLQHVFIPRAWLPVFVILWHKRGLATRRNQFFYYQEHKRMWSTIASRQVFQERTVQQSHTAIIVSQTTQFPTEHHLSTVPFCANTHIQSSVSMSPHQPSDAFPQHDQLPFLPIFHLILNELSLPWAETEQHVNVMILTTAWLPCFLISCWFSSYPINFFCHKQLITNKIISNPIISWYPMCWSTKNCPHGGLPFVFCLPTALLSQYYISTNKIFVTHSLIILYNVIYHS